ncbi:MAG: hypothetical protein JRJ14_06155 [Deltaproteobacteria bacterium]|nr:hypothetical protein [Deltaproteobacteria bacterium]
MRCPKCDYISFDQEEVCKNCSRPLSSPEELTGTAKKVENYLFLSSILVGGRAESKGEEPEVDIGEVFPEDAEIELDATEELEESELEVPTVDISQFEEGSDEELEEEIEEVMGAAVFEAEQDDGIEFTLGDGDEEDQEPETPLPEPEVKLDIDVDLDDEPTDDEIVFNLEDIDESDLIIDEDEAEKEEPSETESPEDDSIPMELAMEDGELVKEEDEEKDKEKLEGTIELPDIDL